MFEIVGDASAFSRCFSFSCVTSPILLDVRVHVSVQRCAAKALQIQRMAMFTNHRAEGNSALGYIAVKHIYREKKSRCVCVRALVRIPAPQNGHR